MEHSVLDNTKEIQEIRTEFPVLDQFVNGKPLVYFDNAATNQKPLSVINSIKEYYAGYNSNIHRGIHTLAEKATTAFEDTRKAVADFIKAPSEEQIIFTKGTTDSINLVASSFGNAFLKKGDEIIISGMEHHSNIVPWQIVAQNTGAVLKVIPVNDKGEINIADYKALVNNKTKLVSVVYASNSLGTINPVKEIITIAHEVGAKVLLDGAQATAHLEINVEELDCDFYAFSGHKMYGPTGVGILYGKRGILEEMPPYQAGGEMIKNVSFEKTTYNDIPYKFEAGTPNIADVIALKEAIQFINRIGKNTICKHEAALHDYASNKLAEIEGVRLIGTATQKVSVVSFIVEDIHHFDIGQMLDTMGVAVRTGHHCTQPLMEHFNIEGTIRASFAVYNTFEEIDILVTALKKVIKFFRK